MKGIILAGGSGSRLYPITKGVSKQLLPVYDKPMIYYPMSVLLLSGIKEILIISTPDDIDGFKRLFKNGSEYGLNIQYAVQNEPKGLAEAFIIGEEFVGEDDVCLILGDNIFHGEGLERHLIKAKKIVQEESKATIFGYYVKDPERYGVAEINENNEVLSIEEKPLRPKSNFAIVGLYFYPNDVLQTAKKITPSDRGELEITSINEFYLNEKKLKLKLLGRGFAWLDTGTHDSLYEAGEYVKALEKRQGLKIACIEEISYKLGYITKDALLKLAKNMGNTEYGQYILNSYS